MPVRNGAPSDVDAIMSASFDGVRIARHVVATTDAYAQTVDLGMQQAWYVRINCETRASGRGSPHWMVARLKSAKPPVDPAVRQLRSTRRCPGGRVPWKDPLRDGCPGRAGPAPFLHAARLVIRYRPMLIPPETSPACIALPCTVPLMVLLFTVPESAAGASPAPSTSGRA